MEASFFSQAYREHSKLRLWRMKVFTHHSPQQPAHSLKLDSGLGSLAMTTVLFFKAPKKFLLKLMLVGVLGKECHTLLVEHIQSVEA
jgi:hypothetical protein